ncbi:hypothetical protein HK100_009601 [Physocladia obscura]|uniref:Aminoglycoside phosphotransferase domain-containing protein n=1 Tax=Physocladia obscura TaxID=109957 RepID=A0AAD5T5T7_9FUNG|nr:hypothetical protein HK100_009601 [Physocladia obscura]
MVEIKDFEDVEWARTNLSLPNIQSVELTSTSGTGGLGGAALHRMIITLLDANTSNSKLHLMLKSGVSQDGRTREAFFYKAIRDRNPQFAFLSACVIPTVYVFGDMATGTKHIIMDDLTASGFVQCGSFYGACSPHNWNKNLQELTNTATETERRTLTHLITINAFKAAAKIHARSWNSYVLLADKNVSWLRAFEWYNGSGETSWQASQEYAASAWRKTNSSTTTKTVKFDPHLIACMNASFSKTSWTGFQTRIKTNPFSLVHGDYHPANLMFRRADDALMVLDWEVVGLGSGPQDVAQYLISHMYPEERRMWEMEFLQAYYDTLVGDGVDGYSFEDCRRDYVAGGVARWVWLLGLLTILCPDEWVQFFQDQLLAFIVDHGVTPDNIEMPRV